MIKEQVREYKKELVLQKASEYLEKEGLAKAKMADIAKYCGISVGALYKLFASKEELFYEYVRYQIKIFDTKLEELFATIDTPQERIKAYLRLKFATFAQKRSILTDTLAGDPLFFAKLAANKENPARIVIERISKELGRMGLRDPLKKAYILTYIAYGYIEYWLVSGEDLEKFAEETYELFMRGARYV